MGKHLNVLQVFKSRRDMVLKVQLTFFLLFIAEDTVRDWEKVWAGSTNGEKKFKHNIKSVYILGIWH